MTNAVKEISEIDFDGEKWITILRNRLCEEGEITEEGIKEAFDNVLVEEKFNAEPKIIEDDYSRKVSKKLLFKLKDNKNVNGLKNNQEIEFSPYFTLIYGQNGTGKTSYYKVLKDAFHSDQMIRINIFGRSNETPSAKIEFVSENEFKKNQKSGTADGFPRSLDSIQWELHDKEERSIKFCDKNILQKSLKEKETGWSVDKFKLGNYEKLHKGIAEVENLIVKKIQKITENVDHAIDQLINGFNYEGENSLKSKIDDYKSDNEKLLELLNKCIGLELGDDNEEIKGVLENKIGRQVSDLSNSIDLIKEQESNLKELKRVITERLELLNKFEGIKKKSEKKQKLEEERDLSTFEKYDLLFSISESTDLSNEYIKLIKEIAETALKFGYEGYPVNIEKCFYCNQELPDDSKVLINEIHELVKNEYQEKLDSLDDELSNYRNKIGESINNIKESYKEFNFRHVKKICSINEKEEIASTILLKMCLEDRSLGYIKDYLEGKDNRLNLSEETIYDHRQQIALIENEINQLILERKKIRQEINEIEKTRQKAKHKLNKIKDKEYLIRSEGDIKKIINDIEVLEGYKNKKNGFKGFKLKVTNSNSNFKQREIWNRYKKQFRDYLSKFNMPNPDSIERKFRNPKGQSHINTKIKIGDLSYPTDEILSEGEAKIHALCDFLTELSLDEINTIVFDDPITSLDHRYIKMFSEVLAGMASDYQVIVFTHSTEFYQELINCTLGNRDVNNPGCGICDDKENGASKDRCHGFKDKDKNVYRCGNYFKLETALKPGLVKDEIEFLRLNYEQRLLQIRKEILEGDTSNLSERLRTTINNFYEHFVLGNIKKQVFTGADLLTLNNKIRTDEFDDEDYQSLIEMHSKLSGRGNLHEGSIENKTPLDLKEYTRIYNSLIDVIRKYRPNVGERINSKYV